MKKTLLIGIITVIGTLSAGTGMAQETETQEGFDRGDRFDIDSIKKETE